MSHFMKTISKLFMPAEARSVETIESFADHQNMAFKLTKLRASYNVDLLSCLCFSVGIANICGP